MPCLTRTAPPNCRFECDDVNHGLGHYKNCFDVVHFRSTSAGVKDGQHFLYEIFDILRPGGILLFVNADGMHREECRVSTVAPRIAGPAETGFNEQCCPQGDEAAPVSSFSLMSRRDAYPIPCKGFSYMVMLVRKMWDWLVVSVPGAWSEEMNLTKVLGGCRDLART